MVKPMDLLANKKRLIAVGLAVGVLILYAVPLGQVSFAPGNGNGNAYGPKGNGPPEFVPRGPNPNPGEPRGQPDGVPPNGNVPPGQEKKDSANTAQSQTQAEDGNNKNKDKNTNTDNKNSDKNKDKNSDSSDSSDSSGN